MPARVVQGVPPSGARRPAGIVDAGRGDVRLKYLRFRCIKCASRRTDSVVMAKDALAVTGSDLASLMPESRICANAVRAFFMS